MAGFWPTPMRLRGAIYYYALADARPQSRKFARRADGGKGGWILRAETFMSPRFRLTAAEHLERTAKWG